MNCAQFYARWPAKEGRLLLFGGGKDHDRLSAYYMVCDHWRKKVNQLDFIWLHEPNLLEVAEACRRDPLSSKHTVVAATEMPWLDPSEAEDSDSRAKRQMHFDALRSIISRLPRDLVLICSTPHENPLTKNALAQTIITKGYWVVLKSTDVETASAFMTQLTGWDEEIVLEVVHAIGTSLADLISFVRVVRLVDPHPPPELIRTYINESVPGTVFELTDAIVMKDSARAYALAASDVPLGQVVGALDRKLTSLVQFMAEMKRGRTPKEAALALHLPGFIVHGLYEASKRWKTAEILQMYSVLANAGVSSGNAGSVDLLVKQIVG